MPETLDEIKKYVGPFSGPQMDQIFYEILNYTSERFAKGTAGGVPVAAGTPGYNDNSLFYKNQAAAQVSLAQAAAAAAANSAQRAESAVPAGTDAAVLWTRDQSAELTADDKALARKNIMAGGSNRNLLMNGWFTINQREITTLPSTTSATLFVDRWKTNRAAGEVRADGVKFAWDGVNSNSATLQQVMDADYSGNTLTASFILNGTIYKHTFNYTGTATIWDFNISGDTWRIQIDQVGTRTRFILYAYGTTQALIKAVKLELGSVSTLANDTAPDHAEELAKCQRYFIRIAQAAGNLFLTQLVAYNSTTTVSFTIPTRLRDSVITITTSGALSFTSGAQSYPISAMSVLAYGSGFVRIQATTSGLTIGSPYFLQLGVGNFIDLSADL